MDDKGTRQLTVETALHVRIKTLAAQRGGPMGDLVHALLEDALRAAESKTDRTKHRIALRRASLARQVQND